MPALMLRCRLNDQVIEDALMLCPSEAERLPALWPLLPGYGSRATHGRVWAVDSMLRAFLRRLSFSRPNLDSLVKPERREGSGELDQRMPYAIAETAL